MNLEAYKQTIKNCDLGKKLPDAIYIHRATLKAYSKTAPIDLLVLWTQKAARRARTRWNIAKFSRRKPAVSLLYYPEFDRQAHPALVESAHVDLVTKKVTKRRYKYSKNPPILHRKELFVHPEHHLYETFKALTEQEEALGLLKECSKVGFRTLWRARCAKQGILFKGHRISQS